MHFKYKPTQTTQVHDKKHHYFTIKPIQKDFYKKIFLVAKRNTVKKKGFAMYDEISAYRFENFKKYCFKIQGYKEIYSN